MINDGGPAYPVDERYETSVRGGSFTQVVAGVEQHLGVSVRDYFAAKAMQGMLAYPGDKASGSWHSNATVHSVADHAYRIADAMLAAREVKHG